MAGDDSPPRSTAAATKAAVVAKPPKENQRPFVGVAPVVDKGKGRERPVAEMEKSKVAGRSGVGVEQTKIVAERPRSATEARLKVGATVGSERARARVLQSSSSKVVERTRVVVTATVAHAPKKRAAVPVGLAEKENVEKRRV